jgi:hypothetical protein
MRTASPKTVDADAIEESSMQIRRPAIITALAAVFASTAVFAQTTPNAPQRKLSNAEKKEIQTVLKILDDAMAGTTAQPNELALDWKHDDLLKAQGNKQYIPFSIELDPSKLNGNNLSLSWRVVAKNPPAPPEAADGKKQDDKKNANAKVEYAYEDLNLIPVQKGQAGPMRISRSFTVAPGAYTIYVVAKDPTPEKPKKGEPAPKLSVIKRELEVKDLWNDELATSTVMIAERIDPLPAPLTPQQQGERPYALGMMEIVPAKSTTFTKQGELSTFMLIYNAKTDAANKPDVSVEYNFYAKQAGAEKFFNKTNPQMLNAQTLPPQFDFAAGHQLQSGQAVPLASFPEGDYRLEIKVTDKIANKTLTRDVNFTVQGS